MTPWFARSARLAGVALLAAFGIAYAIWLPFRPIGAPMTDFSAYYAAGRTWAHGGDPYSREIWQVEKSLPGVDPKRPELLPYVGPPVSLPLWAFFGLFSYRVAMVLWGIVLLACAATIVAVPVVLCRRRCGPGSILSLTVLTLVMGPVVTGISVGQAALPAAACVAVAIACAVARRWTAMTLAAFVAALFKPNDALSLAGALHQPAAVAAAAVAAVLSVAANLPFAGGVHGLLRYVHVVGEQSAAERYFSYQLTPTSIAYGFGMDPHAAAALGTAIGVVAVVLAVAAIVATRASVLSAATIACALFPFAVPFEHEPDLALTMFAGLVVALRAGGGAWAAGALGMTLACVDAFGMAQGWAGIAFSIVTAAVAALQLAVLAPRGIRNARTAPFAAIAVLAVAAAFAPPTKLPMWPDTLPQHVAISANASANVQWHDEIVASGLEEQRPWASLLRTITLTGCLLIAYGAIRMAAAERARFAAGAQP